jgi:uncharacterized 2Fe-2S/4Fe-4S cluster protein (DUF4445 family)
MKPAPRTILEYLAKKKVGVAAVCGGKGKCGLCRVRIKGKRIPVHSAEKRRIPARLLKEGYRLACQQPWTKALRVSVPRPARPAAKTLTNHGLVIDIGTTVIKAAMVDLEKGKITAQRSVFNPQNNLGGDILTRVAAALDGRQDELKTLLDRGIDEARKKLGSDDAARTVVVGNPVMLSFYLDRPMKGYARHPFNGGLDHRSIARFENRRVFPIIGAFVGGDTLAGIYALSRPPSRTFRRLYIDLGTNGEVAVIDKNRIWATSTAAGPAFEGAGITCGSLAVPGAIDRVEFDETYRYHTIGNKTAVGICASGLIDLLAAGLDAGHLSESGRLSKPIRIADFSLTQEDVRTMQLAIAALHAGIRILLDKTGLYSSQIDEAVITGEFGRHLNVASLIRIGIIPTGIKQISLTADLPLRGAARSLVDRNSSRRVARLKKISRHVDLARQPDFQAKFVSSLKMAPWN